MHQYSTNLSSKIRKGVLALPLLLVSTHIFSQSLFESLENSHKSDIENYPKFLQKHLNKPFEVNKIEDLSSIKFHRFFLDNLIFNNRNEVLNLATRDECSLIDLLGTNLLYSSSGKLNYVVVKWQKNAEESEVHTLTKAAYLTSIGYKKCPNSEKLKAFFDMRNVQRTLKSENISFPKSLSECKSIHQNFVNNVKAPYLCEIANKVESLPRKKVQLKNMSKSSTRNYQNLNREIVEAKRLKEIINPTALDFLSNLCSRSYSSSKYCEEIFKKTYWSNSIEGLVSSSPLDNLCRSYLKKPTTSKEDLKLCNNAFAANKSLCSTLGNSAEAMTPLPDCNELSRALSFSRLYKNYKDCPKKVGHLPLVTASRILGHFNKSLKSDSSCELSSIAPFAEFNQKFLESEFWQMSLCYEDKILRKTTCMPTTLFDLPDSEISLAHTMGKTLARLRGFNNKDQSCKVINKEIYNPSLLEFKSGCYIVKEIEECFGVNCKFNVYLNDQLFDKYKISYDLQFDLVPYRFTEANKSFLSLIEKHYKKTSKKVLNISSLKRVFENRKDAIVLGIGCLNDLLPSKLSSIGFNECSPMPFIVDGFIEDSSSYSLITRTSLDYIHAPRIVPWTRIFSSIKNYQRFHPLKEWSFYAIY